MTAGNAATAKTVAIDPDAVGQQASALVSASVAWVHAHWLQIAIAFGVGAIIVLALLWLRSFGPRIARRSASGTGWSAVLGRAIERTGNFFIVMVAARLVSGYAQPPANVVTTIDFLFTIAAVFQVALWARELILGAIEHRTRGEVAHDGLASAMGLIRLLISFAVFAIALVVVLDNLGVNVTGLVAGLGVGGIAIGLAAQGIFADLFAALAIIFDRPFRRGDAISYDSSSGTVEAIGLKSTRIRGLSGEQRIISNKNLLDKEIQNNTLRERRRIKFTLGLAYETPVETLRGFPDAIRRIVEENGMTYVRCGFLQFGGSSLDFDIEFDSISPDFAAAFDARHTIGLAILAHCNDNGITIPFPIQTTYTAAPDGRLILPYSEQLHLLPGQDRPDASG